MFSVVFFLTRHTKLLRGTARARPAWGAYLGEAGPAFAAGSLGEALGSREAQAAATEAEAMKPRPARFVDNKLKQRVVQVCIPNGQASQWSAFGAQGHRRPLLGGLPARTRLAACSSLGAGVELLTTPLLCERFEALPSHCGSGFHGAARDRGRLRLDGAQPGSA